jgi:DTW domain-containing protein YfiP
MQRCGRCALHLHLCLCAEVEPLAVRTRVIVVSTARERQQPTNTGRLVPLTLRGALVRTRGEPVDVAPSERGEAQARRTWLLFPGADSRQLEHALASGPPITLVVPDGTWQATRRMAVREPALRGLPRVHLPSGPPSRYRLRSHPDPLCLATFEAVARALGILEGQAIEEHLLATFERFVERALRARGALRLKTGSR